MGLSAFWKGGTFLHSFQPEPTNNRPVRQAIARYMPKLDNFDVSLQKPLAGNLDTILAGRRLSVVATRIS